jgi:excinuclease UvrABC nuclease subunit
MAFIRGALLALRFRLERYATAFFLVRKRRTPKKYTSHLVSLILGSQKQADTLLRHFGSLNRLARASVQELLPFVSRSKALEIFLRSFLCKSRGTKVL